MANNIVIVNGKKYNLGKLDRVIGKQPEQQHSTGVTLEGVWKTKEDKVLVVTHSVWQKGNSGEVTGTQAYFAGPADIARLADRYGGSLMDLVPEGS